MILFRDMKTKGGIRNVGHTQRFRHVAKFHRDNSSTLMPSTGTSDNVAKTYRLLQESPPRFNPWGCADSE